MNFIYVMNEELIYVHYVSLNMIKIILLLIIVTKIMYVKNITINILNIAKNAKRIYVLCA